MLDPYTIFLILGILIGVGWRKCAEELAKIIRKPRCTYYIYHFSARAGKATFSGIIALAAHPNTDERYEALVGTLTKYYENELDDKLDVLEITSLSYISKAGE